jgi:hypothetical protein
MDAGVPASKARAIRADVGAAGPAAVMAMEKDISSMQRDLA